jgi:myosin V
MEMKRMQVWISDDKEVWKLANLVSANEETEEIVVDDNGLQKTLPASKTHPLDPTHLEDLDDLCSMNNLHEAPLLSILHRRFTKNMIYTTTGNVLVSINPYKTIPGLYDSPMRYLTTSKDFDVASLDETTTPHLFRIANNAFKNVSKETCNQSVIISGESGAGTVLKYKCAYTCSHVHRQNRGIQICYAISDCGQ